MNIQYKTIMWEPSGILRSGRPGELEVYEIKALETLFCCDDMKEAVDGDHSFIGFGEFIDSCLNRDTNVNISDCAPYPEGAVWTFKKILYCPFCMERITTEETKRVRLISRKRRVNQEYSEEVDM